MIAIIKAAGRIVVSCSMGVAVFCWMTAEFLAWIFKDESLLDNEPFFLHHEEERPQAITIVSTGIFVEPEMHNCGICNAPTRVVYWSAISASCTGLFLCPRCRDEADGLWQSFAESHQWRKTYEWE